MLELALLIQHFSIEIILKRAYNYIIMRDLVVDKKYDNKKLSKLIKVIYKINSVDFTYFMFRIINIICK